jgi:3-oxoacyl-[acyl-carrier protein] reductase
VALVFGQVDERPVRQVKRLSSRRWYARESWRWDRSVNNIQPGPIDTDLNPAAVEWAVPQKANTALNRYGSVDDIAALVAFVAGPEASYITGASLTVDGGTNA